MGSTNELPATSSARRATPTSLRRRCTPKCSGRGGASRRIAHSPTCGWTWRPSAATCHSWASASITGPRSTPTPARALEIGPEVCSEYGDAVAQPRLARKFEEARKSVTGSRLGFAGGAVQVLMPTADGRLDVMSGGVTIDGGDFYKDVYYDPETYFAWQDRMWHGPLDTRDEAKPQGTVEIKPLQRVEPED